MRRILAVPAALLLAGAGTTAATAGAAAGPAAAPAAAPAADREEARAYTDDGSHTVHITGRDGNDRITLTDSSDYQTFTVRAERPVQAGEGCEHPDPDDKEMVRCTLSVFGDFWTRVIVDLGPGDDRFTLRGGDQGTVYGGTGDDRLDGEASARLYGEEGDDALIGGGLQYGGPGNDTITGFGGLLSGGFGHDRLIGGDRPESIKGGRGNDTILAGHGADTVYGNSGRDLIHGGRGNDDLFGGPQNDTLYGNSGNDLVRGGPGGDRLSGGPGRDDVRRK